jgi:hypothetical protein
MRLTLHRQPIPLANPLKEIGGRVVQPREVKHIILWLQCVPFHCLSCVDLFPFVMVVVGRGRKGAGASEVQASVIQEMDMGRHEEEVGGCHLLFVLVYVLVLVLVFVLLFVVVGLWVGG